MWSEVCEVISKIKLSLLLSDSLGYAGEHDKLKRQATVNSKCALFTLKVFFRWLSSLQSSGKVQLLKIKSLGQHAVNLAPTWGIPSIWSHITWILKQGGSIPLLLMLNRINSPAPLQMCPCTDGYNMGQELAWCNPSSFVAAWGESVKVCAFSTFTVRVRAGQADDLDYSTRACHRSSLLLWRTEMSSYWLLAQAIVG